MKKFVFDGGITKYWWIPLITGLIAIGLGIWCLCAPASSLPVLAYAFAWLVCLAGLFNVVFAIANNRFYPGWGWSLALGIFELICGIWLLCMPEMVLIPTFIFTIGIYLIVVCINAICESFVVASYANDWMVWILVLLLATLVFAAIFMAGPVTGGIAVWLWIGISLITFGCYRIMLAAKLKKINRKIRF